MNYYERHLGDYAKDTRHLSMLEHGAYTLLLDRYYATEQPIPADQVYRVTGARSKEEREAVDTVLQEFFKQVDGVWRKNRCDEVIADYQDGEPEREAAREGVKERKRRSRERRKELFAILRTHGVVPHYKTSISELEAMMSRVTTPDTSRTGHGDVTHESRVTSVTKDAKKRDGSRETDAHVTATQSHSPIPIPQSQSQDSESPRDISSQVDSSVAGSLTLTALENGAKPGQKSGKERKASRAKSRRLPAEHPIEPLRLWALQHAPGVDFDREIAKVRDHQFRDAHSDWDAVIRNWLRRAQEQSGPRRANGQPPSPTAPRRLTSGEIIEQAIRDGCTDAQIAAMPELDLMPDVLGRIAQKREEIRHAEH